MVEEQKQKELHWYDGLIAFLEYTGILNEMKKSGSLSYRGVPMLGKYDKEVPIRPLIYAK